MMIWRHVSDEAGRISCMRLTDDCHGGGVVEEEYVESLPIFTDLIDRGGGGK